MKYLNDKKRLEREENLDRIHATTYFNGKGNRQEEEKDLDDLIIHSIENPNPKRKRKKQQEEQNKIN